MGIFENAGKGVIILIVSFSVYCFGFGLLIGLTLPEEYITDVVIGNFVGVAYFCAVLSGLISFLWFSVKEYDAKKEGK